MRCTKLSEVFEAAQCSQSQRKCPHLRGPVEPALDVAVHRLRLKTSRAKVDNFDVAQGVFEQDVLWLQVAVDDGGITQQGQGPQDLQAAKEANFRQRGYCSQGLQACQGLALCKQQSGRLEPMQAARCHAQTY